jgi:CheY-like chemotaxis protein
VTTVLQGTLSVLIVEDDAEIRETLSELLRDEGYSAAGAAHGDAALSYLRVNALPSLILLDLMMPVMSGWEFRAAQRQDPRLAGVPVVVISGDSDVASKATAIQADGYLNKPIDVDQLMDFVSRYCQPS